MRVYFCGCIYKVYWRNERKGWEWWRWLFRRKNRVTPSVTAPGDTNLSDATVFRYTSSGLVFVLSSELSHPTRSISLQLRQLADV